MLNEIKIKSIVYVPEFNYIRVNGKEITGKIKTIKIKYLSSITEILPVTWNNSDAMIVIDHHGFKIPIGLEELINSGQIIFISYEEK